MLTMTSFHSLSEQRQQSILSSFLHGSLPVTQLKQDRTPLSGANAQALRSNFVTYSFHPADCTRFDLAAALLTANKDSLEIIWQQDNTHGQAKRVWEAYRDSPNSLPLFDILQLGAWTDLLGDEGIIQERHYQVLQWLIEKGLNTEGIDVAGYTALQHSLSGNPLTFDFRWSTILLNASECQLSAINHRNRFGATSLHEAVMSMHREGENEIKLEIIEFLLEHGANGDIPDNDGCNARSTAAKSSPAFNILFDEAERLIIDSGACQFCHRGGIKGKGKGRVGEREEGEIRANLRCSACRSVTYCSALCQKLDYRSHKLKCQQ